MRVSAGALPLVRSVVTHGAREHSLIAARSFLPAIDAEGERQAIPAGLLVLPTGTHPSRDGSSRPGGERIHGATAASEALLPPGGGGEFVGPRAGAGLEDLDRTWFVRWD